MKVRRALISVSDKTGIVEFAKRLSELGVEIISTGGTAKLLKESGIAVKEVSEITGFPEILDGRVKTLHPVIHGGILAKRDTPAHLTQLNEHGIPFIDLVVVNLYPFRETVEKGASFEEIIENIDIGGPTLIRSSAKNFKFVAVVVDPEDYQKVISEIEETGEVSEETRFYLARKAFSLTAFYDAVISQYFNSVDSKGIPVPPEEFPKNLTIPLEKVCDMRYGENPHQRASFYRDVFSTGGVANAEVLYAGKPLSFNNICDIDSAFGLACEFDVERDGVSCVIVKHSNPCGVAVSCSPVRAYELALQTDPISAFGGIVAFNSKVDEETARLLIQRFYECVCAPDFEESAVEILKSKKNLRVLKIKQEIFPRFPFDLRKVSGGVLVQDTDSAVFSDMPEVVSGKEPSEEEWKELEFAFKVVKWVKSNGVVFAKGTRTLAIGVGQTSRIDAIKCAIEKARSLGFDLKGSVLASEAFFPFKDAVEEAYKVGVKAIIQPGGSIRDEEVIETARNLGITMVFTKIRHFRH